MVEFILGGGGGHAPDPVRFPFFSSSVIFTCEEVSGNVVLHTQTCVHTHTHAQTDILMEYEQNIKCTNREPT